MPIHCVVCFRDESGSYYQNAYITLLSIFENTKAKLCVHVLHDETITHGQADLHNLCDKYGHLIKFHHVPALDAHTAEVVSQKFNLGATYRYYLHEFIAADKAIYLDCDVVVNRDIRDLHDIDIENHLFASTLDPICYWKNGKVRKKYQKTVEYLQLQPDSYINSGVLLINVKKLREISTGRNLFVEKTLAAVKADVPLPHPDMDIINSVGCEVPHSILILDPRFNLWHGALHMSLDELENTIFHFIVEPYLAFYPAHLLFWKYYAKSPFADDMFERMSKACQSNSMTFVKYYLLNARHRQHATDLLKYGVIGGIVHTIKRKLFKK